MVNSDVNWRSRSLQPYESLYSLGAKFCYLNRISPTVFHAFLQEFAGSSSNSSYLLLAGDPTFRLSQLARKLGEPISVIRSTSIESMLPPIGLKESVKGVQHSMLPKRLRYCCVCIEKGFHATYHQLPWLSHCLIHEEPFGLLKKSERLDDMSDINITKELFDLLFGSSSKWDYKNCNAWKNFKPRQKSRNVHGYISWTKNLWRYVSKEKARFLFFEDFNRNIGELESLKDFLHCMTHMTPNGGHIRKKITPSRIREFSLLKEIKIEPQIGGKLKDLFQKHDFQDFLTLRLLEQEFFVKRASWNIKLRINHDAMAAMHYKCVETIQSTLGSFWGCSLSGKFSFPENCCERVFLLSLVEREWVLALNPSGKESRKLKDWLTWYTAFGRLLSLDGITVAKPAVIESATPSGEPLRYQTESWTLIEPLARILDLIISAQAIASARELFEAELKGVAKTPMVHFYIRTLRPVVSIEQLDHETLQLRIWRRAPYLLPNWSKLDQNMQSHEERRLRWLGEANAHINQIRSSFCKGGI